MKGFALIVVTLIWTLTSCGIEPPDHRANASSTTTITAGVTVPAPTPIPSVTGGAGATSPPSARPTLPPPSAGRPDVSVTILPEAEQEFMLRLEDIRPDLSSDEEFALRAGRRVCAVAADASNGPAQIRAATQREFTQGKPLTQEQLTAVYENVTEVLCPDTA